MSRTLFENSKAALAFAGLTIVGAVIMIGPNEGGGVLDRTVDRYAEEREIFNKEIQTFAEEQSVPDEVFDPESGWGGGGEAVFGDFMPDNALSGVSESVFADASPPQPVQPARPAQTTSAARQALRTPQAPPPVKADNEGVVVPRPDQQQADNQPRRVPVITDRQMTITPQ